MSELEARGAPRDSPGKRGAWAGTVHVAASGGHFCIPTWKPQCPGDRRVAHKEYTGPKVLEL